MSQHEQSTTVPSTRARRYRRLLAGLGALGVAAAGGAGLMVAAPASQAATAAPALHVSGAQLVTSTGAPVQLRGVDRSGTEYACVQGWGIFDGPSDSTSVATIASWHTNAVRVPLNEDCWLGINGVAAAYSGANYRNAIVNYVNELNAAGLQAVLDLHWGAPGTTLATSQEQMPDASHAPAFWTSVATTFAHDPAVMFDLFNEPHDVSWNCWRNGCYMANGVLVSGMQTLLNDVRATGATQPVLVEGLGWANDLSGWLAYAPSDPLHNVAASAHIYNFTGCNTSTCWNSVFAPIAAKYPLVTGEFGETDCTANWIDTYMPWADSHGVSYLAWTWNAGGGWSCSNGPALLNSYDGTPNAFGAGYKQHLAALASSAPAVPAPAPAPSVSTSAKLTQSWGNGGIVDLRITNTGTTTLGSAAHPWKVSFTLPAGTTVSSMWNAVLQSQSGGLVHAVAPSYALSLAPGAGIDVGWVQNGSTALPSQVAVGTV